MLAVSLAATCYLANLLDEAAAPGDVAVRFVWQSRERRICLRMDHAAADDARWKQGLRTVLVCAPVVVQRLASLELRLEPGPTGERLVFATREARKSA